MINKKIRIISITGTPGTGKTVVAKMLAKKLGANLIEVSELVKNRQIPYTIDRKRLTKVIDVKKMKIAIRKKILKGRINIIDGHLSHLVKSDLVVVLRTAPRKLEKRLKNKRYKSAKIKENVQAEILDSILIEVLAKYPKSRIVEINTTAKTAHSTSRAILRVLNNLRLQRLYSPGKIRWLKKHYRMIE